MSSDIQTERLFLRMPRADDAPVVAALAGDLDVSRWMTRAPHPYTLKDAQDFIRTQRAGTGHTRFIEHQGVVVGCVATANELGYWIGKPYWGNGFATEAARAMAARHFQQGHDTLTSGHFASNTASRAVLTKLGFRDTHMESATSPATGDVHDLQRMSLSRSIWETLQ